MHYKTYRQLAEKAANPEIQHPLPLALLAIDASVGIQASVLVRDDLVGVRVRARSVNLPLVRSPSISGNRATCVLELLPGYSRPKRKEIVTIKLYYDDAVLEFKAGSQYVFRFSDDGKPFDVQPFREKGGSPGKKGGSHVHLNAKQVTVPILSILLFSCLDWVTEPAHFTSPPASGYAHHGHPASERETAPLRVFPVASNDPCQQPHAIRWLLPGSDFWRGRRR